MPSYRHLGGKLEHIDSPLIWLKGASGQSDAYVLPLDNYKLVIISVKHFKITGLHDGSWTAQLPESLQIADDTSFIRMALSQYVILGNTGSERLDLWMNTTDASKYDNELFGTVFYLAKK